MSNTYAWAINSNNVATFTATVICFNEHKRSTLAWNVKIIMISRKSKENV